MSKLHKIKLSPNKKEGVEISQAELLLNRYLELEAKKAAVAKYYEEIGDLIQEIANTLGVDSSFQDSEGIVYHIATREWKPVRMEAFTINRTKREGEARASLSLVKAKELGWEV